MDKLQIPFMWLAIGLVVGWIFGLCIMESGMKNQAIQAGVAEYIVDKTTGTVIFQYIAPCKTH